MYFELIGEISHVETIAATNAIRDLAILRQAYGGRRWRKLKGIGLVKLANNHVCQAEIHWYECHSIGRKRMKIKRLLD